MKEKEIDYSKIPKEDFRQFMLNQDCEEALKRLEEEPEFNLTVRVKMDNNGVTLFRLYSEELLEAAKKEIRAKIKPVTIYYK